MPMAEEIEYWRVRAMRAEELMKTNFWDLQAHPLTLFETRIVRLLGKHRECSFERFYCNLYSDRAEETDVRTLRALISRIRAKVPEIKIASIYSYGWRAEDPKFINDWLAKSDMEFCTHGLDTDEPKMSDESEFL